MSPLSSVRRKYDIRQRQSDQQRSEQPGPAALRTALDDRLESGPVAVQAVETGYVAAIPFPQNDSLLEQHQAGPGPDHRLERRRVDIIDGNAPFAERMVTQENFA